MTLSCDLLNLTDGSIRIVLEIGGTSTKISVPLSSGITPFLINSKVLQTSFTFYITYPSHQAQGNFYVSNFKCNIQ